MTDTKLLQILKKIPEKQIKRLVNYLNSPYFTINEDAKNLVHYYIEQIQKGKESDLEDEICFTFLYGEKPYNKTRLQKLRSLGWEAVENFLIFEDADTKNIKNRLSLLSFYTENDLSRLYEMELKSIRQLLVPNEYLACDFYYLKFLIEEKHIRFLTRDSLRDNVLDIGAWSNSIEEYYILRKLEYFCVTSNNQHIFNTQFPKDAVLELLHYLEKHAQLLRHPLIQIYYNLLHILLFPEQELFFLEAIRTLELHHTQFYIEDNKNLYTYATNYCVQQINLGKSNYNAHLLALYESQIKLKLLYDHTGRLLPATFRNIVVLALRLDKTEWAKDFIAEQQPFLPEEKREEVVNYCLAKYYFELKNYRPIYKLLSSLACEDVFFDIAARKLLMQTYYENQEWEILNDRINSFRVFLSRNKTISEKHKKSNQNFTTILSKLINLPPNDAEKAKELQKQMEGFTPLAEKDWLFQKVKEFGR